MLSRLEKPTLLKDEAGFTLIELLIVVLIIGILAAIAIPVYLGVQTQAKKGATQSAVNSAVTTMQVALTEGAASTAAAFATVADSDAGTAGAQQGKVTVTFLAGTGSNYQLCGSYDDVSGYYYDYDSSTGNFTSDTTSACGSSGGSGGGGNTTTVASWDMEGTAPNSATDGIQALPYQSTLVTDAAAHSPSHDYTMTGTQGELDFFFPVTDFTAGKTYTFSVWVRGNGGTSQIYYGVNDGIVNDNIPTTGATTWSLVSEDYTAPAVPRAVFFTVRQANSTGYTTSVDDIKLVQH